LKIVIKGNMRGTSKPETPGGKKKDEGAGVDRYGLELSAKSIPRRGDATQAGGVRKNKNSEKSRMARFLVVRDRFRKSQRGEFRRGGSSLHPKEEA